MTIEQVISKVHTAAPEHDFAPGFPSVDTIKYGDIKKECTGVALACAPSAQVLKTMGEKGLNLLIAHEPLFYTNVDTTDWLEAKSDVYEAKKAILDKYHIVVWRYHDHMHVHKPDMIYTGVARELGWMPYLEGDKNKPVFFRLPETTLKKLAEYLKEKIGLNNVRCIGNMNVKVSTVYMCNTAKDKERSLFRLRKTFGNIICEHILNPEGDNAHKLSVFYELADCLLKEYMTSDSNYSALLNENTQIEKLLQYINQNYRREIRQSELCKLLYLSPSGFSRYFKKNIGMGYISYLTNIRLQSAMMELRMTSKSITDIALENGFTTPSAFNKIFRESKGATPSEYRKGLQEKLGNTKSLEDIIARQFLKNHMADNVDLEKTYEK